MLLYTVGAKSTVISAQKAYSATLTSPISGKKILFANSSEVPVNLNEGENFPKVSAKNYIFLIYKIIGSKKLIFILPKIWKVNQQKINYIFLVFDLLALVCKTTGFRAFSPAASESGGE